MQRPDRFGEEIDLLENATWLTNDGQPKSIGKKKKEESAEEAEEAEFLFSPGYGRRPAMRVSERVHPTACPIADLAPLTIQAAGNGYAPQLTSHS